MLNSARITCDFLGLHAGDEALLCMPLDFIAGKMMVVRSIERYLDLHTVEPSNHPLKTTDETYDLVAMVPSQVYCSMQVAEERERLMRTKHLIIGGGAISKDMERELQSFPNAVWSTYGMTETLSHIALRRINGTGASQWYTPFESVAVSQNEDGCLVIDAPLVHDGQLVTNDIAELRPAGGGRKSVEFRIIGRRDNVVCSGGIKLQIEAIEEKLEHGIKVLPSGDDRIGARKSFCVTKRADEKFGEVVVLLTTMNIEWQQLFDEVLSPYEKPKYIIKVKAIPMTATGKIDRKTAMTMVKE